MEKDITDDSLTKDDRLFESSNEPNDANSKEERINKEKKELLSKVVSGQIQNVKDRVAYILNHSIDSRNSDIELAWLYWTHFEKESFSGATISKEEMYKVAKISSLSRIRAKIQNEYKLFQADNIVKKYRGTLEENQRLEAIEEKPSGLGLYHIYIDESGKTQEYLSVGSLWILKFDILAITKAQLELNKWKKDKAIDFEFHFKELSKSRLNLYKEFFIKFISLLPETGFKLIVVNNRGFSDQSKAITDLTFHLILKGVLHENESGRAPLPRHLQVILDEEEKGADQLKIQNIKERLKSQKLEGLYLGDFESVSSKDSFYIQVVDLFTASINRKLHSTTDSHFKDDFANFVFETLNFDFSKIDKQNSIIDNSTIFNLSDLNTK